MLIKILFGLSLLCMIGGGRYNATVGLSPAFSNISALFMVMMSLRSLIPLVKHYGYRGRSIIISLGLFALIIETIGITTGFPYGSFEYGELLGYKLGGITPRTVFIGWTPLVIGSYMLGGLCTTRLSKILFTNLSTKQLVYIIILAIIHLVLSTVILVSFDFVLDPGAVFLGMRYFEYPGIYYGVPWTNFGGWVVSGIIGWGIIYRHIPTTYNLSSHTKQHILSSGLYLQSTLLNLCFWISVSITVGYSIPSVIGIIQIIIIVYVVYNSDSQSC